MVQARGDNRANEPLVRVRGFAWGSGQSERQMARWPRHVWTSIFTYATVFVLFPLLCLLAYAWVRGLIF